ncbi:MAG: hypothetical protein ACRDKY_12530 [Solirubrobacteraceae bacterium]
MTAGTPSLGAAPAPAPAKLAVKRAAVRDGKLDVLATVTSRASGTVRLRYRSAGRTTRFSARIKQRRIRVVRPLRTAQRTKRTGILTLTYPGSKDVQAESVTLRAAPRAAKLRRTASSIDGHGRLHLAGTISRRARGIVRVRLSYVELGGAATFELHYKVAIAAGAWSMTAALPRAAAALGGQLAIRYAGYGPRLIGGEQLASRVAP